MESFRMILARNPSQYKASTPMPLPRIMAQSGTLASNDFE